MQQRQHAVLSVLRKVDFTQLREKRILEVGCGGGGVLLQFLLDGAAQEHLHGIDLLPDRLVEAHHKLPDSLLACADGQRLPYSSASFDMVMQFTAFSSILDDQVRANMACEMLRVLRQDGLILWYDFWLNPTNPQTRGIRPQEIKTLFSNCQNEFHKVTLAPPIARRIAPIAWGVALLLESMKIFNTHYLVLIKKNEY